MKSIGGKHPTIFEIIIIVIGFLLAGVVAGVINIFCNNGDVSASIARILVGLTFLAIFHREFKLGNSFKGVMPMLPLLLLALYKIPYHFISGGEAINAITISVLLIGLAPAVFEEVLFRGIFISNLKKKGSL